MQDHQPHRLSRACLITACITVASVSALVYWTATARPMWVDEEMLALNVRDRGFLQLAGPLWLDQSAPLGWLVLERLLMLGVGTGERAVRALTVLFGTGTLAAAWWIGRRWMTPFGAVVLVALCGTGEWLVFFTLELKHYSADAAGALVVAGLAAWVLDADHGSRHGTPTGERRSEFGSRSLRWWAIAALAMWFSNGALFVTPACALVLVAAALARRDRRGAGQIATGGVGWLASFAVLYILVLRHALANAYLKNYWAFAFPPTAEGTGAVLGWLGGQFGPFAVKPAGSGLPVFFWAAYLTGIVPALMRRSSLAIVFATVPLSAIALAVAHFVPTFERLAIWSVPSMYVGVALCADAGAGVLAGGRAAAAGSSRWRHLRYAALPVTLVVLITSYDIVRRGVYAIGHRPRSNYGLDDRSSVRWLLDGRQPGDAVLSTHYGLAAIWWYAGINVADTDASGRMSDGAPLYEIHHVADVRDCPAWDAALAAIARDRSRVVVYLGFRMNVEPEGFDRLVLEELGRRWPLVGYKEYAEVSRLAIFDVTQAPGAPLVIPTGPRSLAPSTISTPSGCVSVTPARRW